MKAIACTAIELIACVVLLRLGSPLGLLAFAFLLTIILLESFGHWRRA